jgi:hypothetical protein
MFSWSRYIIRESGSESKEGIALVRGVPSCVLEFPATLPGVFIGFPGGEKWLQQFRNA